MLLTEMSDLWGRVAMIKKIFLTLCIVSFFLISACVSTQNFSMLENRVAMVEMQTTDRGEVENKKIRDMALDLKRLASDLEKNQRIAQEDSAELKSLVEEIKSENRRLAGRLEALEHMSKNMGDQGAKSRDTDLARIDAAVSRNFQRLISLEDYMGFEPSEVKVDGEVQGEKQPDDTSETGLYTVAKTALDREEFEPARKGFETFIKRYPESDNADNARFWIAESYYREKWYEKAILEYQKVIENYPKGNKVPAALLKQGFAFGNLGEKANARLILKELIRKYPGSNEAKIAAEKLKAIGSS